MKLYSIWWEEEIALMCSCNDCSKKKNRRRRENCLPFASCESLERNQSFESEVFCFVQSQLTPPNSCSSELTQMPTTGSQGFDPGNFKLLWHAEAAGVTAFWFTEAVCHFAKKKKKCECLWWWRMRLDVWRKHSVARRTWESRCGRHLSSVLGATHFTDSVWKGIAGWEAVIECNCVWQPETTASKHRTCWKMKIEVHLGTWKNKFHLFFSFRFFSNVSKQLYPPELYGPVSNVKKQKPFQ